MKPFYKLAAALVALAVVPSASLALCPVPTGVSAQTGIYNLMPDSKGGISVGQYGNLEGGERRREGTFYYDSANKKMMLCNGTDWMSVLASGGSGDTGTAGTAPPSKELVYGPYDIPRNSTRTLAAIQEPASRYVIVPQITPGSWMGECAMYMMINGSWKRIAYRHDWQERVHVDRGEYEYRNKTEAETKALTANMQPSGKYQMYFGAFSPAMTLFEGNLTGQIRTESDGWECGYKIVFRRTVDD